MHPTKVLWLLVPSFKRQASSYLKSTKNAMQKWGSIAMDYFSPNCFPSEHKNKKLEYSPGPTTLREGEILLFFLLRMSQCGHVVTKIKWQIQGKRLSLPIVQLLYCCRSKIKAFPPKWQNQNVALTYTPHDIGEYPLKQTATYRH